MKNVLKRMFVLTLMISSATLLTNCDKDEDPTDGGGGNEHLTAKVDGADYAASKDPASIIGATKSSGTLTVQGGDNSGQTIRLIATGYTGVGTYTFGGIGNGSSGTYITNPTDFNNLQKNTYSTSFRDGNLGTIEVTKDDDSVVEGTFSFEGFNSESNKKTITEGSFKANLD